MIGTIINVFAIILGSLIGLIFKGGMPKKINETLMNGLALCVILIGMSGALKGIAGCSMLLVIISIVIGAIIGEILDIDKGLNNLGNNLEKGLKGRGGKIAEGFVDASLLYCVGAMAILGAIQDGLTGNHTILIQKSMLDGITAITYASTFGIGVMFSAVSVLLYQGTIALSASLISGLLTTDITNAMNAVGSLLIIGIGLNMLKITKIKLANLLPAVIIPILYELLILGYKYVAAVVN
ncbi:MAG TPA: DUF554 domain-containing protein [Clostridiaceae bacterium]